MKDLAYWNDQFKELTPFALDCLKMAIRENDVFIQEVRVLEDVIDDLERTVFDYLENDKDDITPELEDCVLKIEACLLTLDRG